MADLTFRLAAIISVQYLLTSFSGRSSSSWDPTAFLWGKRTGLSKQMDCIKTMTMFKIIILALVFAMVAAEKDGPSDQITKPKPKDWYKKWVENDEVPYVQSVKELGEYLICYQLVQMLGRKLCFLRLGRGSCCW